MSVEKPQFIGAEGILENAMMYEAGPTRPRTKVLPPRLGEDREHSPPFGVVNAIRVEGALIEVDLA